MVMLITRDGVKCMNNSPLSENFYGIVNIVVRMFVLMHGLNPREISSLVSF